VFAGASGSERTLDELTLADFQSWGSALGELHAMLRRYPATTSPWESWQARLDFAEKHVEDDELVVGEIETVRASLATIPVDHEHFGLIHGDFELDNLFWNGRISGIIDFESAVLHWHIADVALALEPLAENERARDAFLAGYAEFTSLDERVWASRDVFLRYSELLRYAKIVRSLDLPSADDIPPWLLALQTKLERTRGDYRARLEEGRRRR
jgi:Ser/Thr protein kinase RdoA (MazF antagonist)